MEARLCFNVAETRGFYSWAGTLLNYRLVDCGHWWIYIGFRNSRVFWIFLFSPGRFTAVQSQQLHLPADRYRVVRLLQKRKKKSETIIPLLIGNCVAFVRGDCAGQVPSLSTHSMYIKGMQYFSLSFHQYIISCVLCVLFFCWCVACVLQSCSVSECVCLSVIDKVPGHLSCHPPPPLVGDDHWSQNFLYFQNRLFPPRRRAVVGGLRGPCVAFYEPSQLHALVAAAGKTRGKVR